MKASQNKSSEPLSTARFQAAEEAYQVKFAGHSVEPVRPGNFNGIAPEFGRVADVARMFGIKRGTLYNLLRDGKIRGVLLRVRGQQSGVRLIDLDSVRSYIRSQFDQPTVSAQ